MRSRAEWQFLKVCRLRQILPCPIRLVATGPVTFVVPGRSREPAVLLPIHVLTRNQEEKTLQ